MHWLTVLEVPGSVRGMPAAQTVEGKRAREKVLCDFLRDEDKCVFTQEGHQYGLKTAACKSGLPNQ